MKNIIFRGGDSQKKTTIYSGEFPKKGDLAKKRGVFLKGVIPQCTLWFVISRNKRKL